MKKLLLASLLLAPSLASAELYKTVPNQQTGKIDFVTRVDSTTIKAGSNVSVVTTSSGVTISASGGGGGGTTIWVQEDGAAVDNFVSTLNFTNGFNTTSSPSGQANVSIDYSTVASRGDVILNTSTIQTATFYTSSGTVQGDKNFFINGENATSRVMYQFVPLPRNGGFGPQTKDSLLYFQGNQSSGQGGTFTLAAGTYTPTSPGVAPTSNVVSFVLSPMGGADSLGSGGWSINGNSVFLATSGTTTVYNQFQLDAYDCTGKTNGGKLTTDADGIVSCQDDTSGSGGGGSSSLAVTTGTLSGFSGVPISSPTNVISLDQNTFLVTLPGGTTAFLRLNPSSVTLMGQNVLSLASASANYVNYSTAANYMTLSSMTNYGMSIASMSAYGVSQSSLSANYSNSTLIAATYLSLSSAIVNVVNLTGTQNISGTKTITSSLTVTNTVLAGTFTASQNGAVPVAGITNAPLQVLGNQDGFTQLNIQNFSTGTSASGDLVITSNLGGNTSNYVNLGINGNNFSQASQSIVPSTWAYLWSSDGGLAIGSGINGTQSTADLVFFTSAPTTANERMRIKTGGAVVVSSSLTVTSTNGITCTYGINAGSVSVTDEVYGSAWDGSTQTPTKNAVYDKIQTITGGSGVVQSDSPTWTGPHQFLNQVNMQNGSSGPALSVGSSSITIQGSSITIGYGMQFVVPTGNDLSTHTLLGSIGVSNGAFGFGTGSIFDTLLGATSSQVFLTTGTFTPHPKMKFAFVEVVGGGGSGQICDGTDETSGGGGAGEYRFMWYSSSTLFPSQSVGVGVAASTGNAGAPTTFGSLITAKGGSVGISTTGTTVGMNGAGGNGGTGGTGGYGINGGDGRCGVVASTNWGEGGMGGASHFAGGGRGGAGQASVGENGRPGYGGSGGGGCSAPGAADTNSGSGGAGFVRITQFLTGS